MATLTTRSRSLLLVVAAVTILVWGSVGLYQGLHRGFSGGLYDPEYRVPGVAPGSPAEKAGFRAGDRVVSVEGRPVEQLGMESRWPRSLTPGIGESRHFVVERQGELVSLDMVYQAPFRSAVNARLWAAFIGLSFLGIGLWAWFTVRTPPAAALACIGFAAGMAMSLGLGPDLGAWNGVPSHTGYACQALIFILLLRFFLTFPVPKRVSARPVVTWAIYGPWVLFLAFLTLELIVHPVLYYTYGTVASFLMLGYSVLIVAAIAHTVVKSARGKLWESGMGLILAGFLVVIVPFLAAFLGIPVPGSSYLPALLVVIPLTMALAVRKQARFASAYAAAQAG